MTLLSERVITNFEGRFPVFKLLWLLGKENLFMVGCCCLGSWVSNRHQRLCNHCKSTRRNKLQKA